MKELLHDLVRRARGPLQARGVVREYLQARILESLQRSGAMISLAFHGGSALRFLHGIPRHSEDLDFTLEHYERGYDLNGWTRAVIRTLQAERYAADARLRERGVVHSAFVRVRGLLHELGLSPHREQVVGIRVEIDTRPPAGVGLETTLVRRHVALHLHHHDRPSLLAGKIHAVLQRGFVKGRDLYDLLWYLSDRRWPPPNILYLAHALEQTGWPGPPVTDATWRTTLADRVRGLDWSAVVSDVQPFLEDPEASRLLTRDNLLRLIADSES